MNPNLALLNSYPVGIVYPIAQERYIVRINTNSIMAAAQVAETRDSLSYCFRNWSACQR